MESKRVLALSTAAFTLLFAVWLMFGVLAVAIKDEFQLSKIQFSWLAAIAILSGSIFRLPVGILTDRWGGRITMTVLLLATAIPCALVSAAATLPQLMAGALLLGVAGNSFSTGIAWNAAWWSRERQGFALGTFGAGNAGASLTKIVGPALIAVVPGGWRFIPLCYAAMLLVMAALVWFGAPRPDRKPGSGRSLLAMLAPLRTVRVWRFGLYYVVVFGAFVALSLWLPSYYVSVYKLSLVPASLATALFIVPASLLSPLGGWLSDRFGARRVTYAVFACILAACVPLGLARETAGLSLGPRTFFTLVEIIGVAMGIGKASIYKYIQGYFPKDVGAVAGLVGTLGALGGFVLPITFGYLDNLTGRPESCFSSLLVLTAASFLWLNVVVVSIKRRASMLQLEGA